MSEFQASNFKKENGGTPDLLGKTELTSPYFFVPPSGTTAERPENCAAGTLRFNTDIGTLEVYRGDVIGWEQIQRRESQYLGGGTGSNLGTGTRGIILGGEGDGISNTNIIEYITIESLGNTQDFGDLVYARRGGTQNCGSRVRALAAGGYTGPTDTDGIDFILFSSTGNAMDFGDLTSNTHSGSACSTDIRGIFTGGYTGSGTVTNNICYVTIASTQNAVDFGDLSRQSRALGSCQSTTRGIQAGGAPSNQNTMDFITMATTGNATDYGYLTVGRDIVTGGGNSIRGIFAGGRTAPAGARTNVIDVITIATLGNATDFGDLPDAAYMPAKSSACSSLRMVMTMPDAGPYTAGFDFVDIATLGNVQDFGDASTSMGSNGANSNGHGGL